jgi:hypothetical protein
MNCIDAVEAAAKVLLERFLRLAIENRQDLSEYIRDVKAVIDGVVQFIGDNPEVSDTPELVFDELYEFAKARWLAQLKEIFDVDQDAGVQDLEYQAYCYDYLYAQDAYPR